jgi:hypothetical protein
MAKANKSVVTEVTANEVIAAVVAVAAITAKVTKKQRTIDALQNGTTLAALAAQLEISLVAARSLIGDVRAAKIAVCSVRDVATNVYTFWLTASYNKHIAATQANAEAVTA